MCSSANLSVHFCDLLDARADYIVQPCDCVNVAPYGISAHVANRFPYAEPYSLRGADPHNSVALRARVDSRPEPGSILTTWGTDVVVVSAFVQLHEGKPGNRGYLVPRRSRSKDGAAEETTMVVAFDDFDARKAWFESCLRRIGELVEARRCLESRSDDDNRPGGGRRYCVAFPHGMCCRSSGGDWNGVYRPCLERFARDHPDIDAVLCLKVPPPPPPQQQQQQQQQQQPLSPFASSPLM